MKCTILGGKCSDVLGKETSFNWFADAELFGVMVNPVSPNIVSPYQIPEYCIPVHDSLVNRVRGYNICVVD